MPLLAFADQKPWEGFSATNLVILIAILAVLWPAMRWIRRRVSEGRRERWAREEDEQVRYTEEDDPDLRRNTPEG
jgi:flagellar biosynthesis/type III secretory pathway M-ring protein FliF/YscJ